MARAGAEAGVASAFMGAGQYLGGAVVGLLTGWIGMTPGVLAAALLTCGPATVAFVAAAGVRPGKAATSGQRNTEGLY